MDVFEAMRTTRAMRRLDSSKPVSDDDLWTILEAAGKGATGSNRQPVRWIVVRDADKRRRLGDLYREVWAQARQMYGSVTDPTNAQLARILKSADHLGEHMGDAPVIIIPAGRGADPASVYPGVQNLFLAARALGLGTTLTTIHKFRENDVREILGIPEDVETFAMIPLGYPLGRWGEAKRRPIAEITYWDTWKATQPRP